MIRYGEKSIGKNGAKDPNIETFRLRMAALEGEKKKKSHPRIVSATSVQRLLLRVLVTYDM